VAPRLLLLQHLPLSRQRTLDTDNAAVADGSFLDYATYNNISGAVLFLEKTRMVGRLQIAFDPNCFPLTDKSSDNPRYKFLHALLARGSDAIDAAADNAALDTVVEV
jgi:hypothetical protein